MFLIFEARHTLWNRKSCHHRLGVDLDYRVSESVVELKVVVVVLVVEVVV